MIALQAYTSGSVESWTVSGSFGQRRFIAITPLLVLGLAAWFSHARTAWTRRALAAIVLLCIWWNLGLMAQFGLNRMDRSRLVLKDNARVTFIELPREAPSIAWRYLSIARRSTYRSTDLIEKGVKLLARNGCRRRRSSILRPIVNTIATSMNAMNP